MDKNKKVKHPRHVVGYRGSKQRLARNIGNMTYDEVAVFLGHLAADFQRQATDDQELRGRVQLARKLENAAAFLRKAEEETEAAWNICRKYM